MADDLCSVVVLCPRACVHAVRAPYQYCTREKRSYIEVLADFPASRPPLPRLLELIPRIKPRAFSIASSCR